MRFGRAARLGVFGLSAFAAVAAAGGCSVRNQMPRHRFAQEHKPSPVESPYFAPEVEQSTANMQQLSGLPAGVQTSFTRDYPSAGITSVHQVPSGTGPMLYRITFIDGGTAGTATYRASGQDLADGGREVIIRDGRSVPEAAATGATTGID